MNYKVMAAIPFAALFFFSYTANANPAPKAEKCPGIEAIKAASPLLNIWPAGYPDGPAGFWTGNQFQNFDTMEKWGFAMGPIAAKNQDEAFERIKFSLEGLFLVEGPTIDKLGCNICKYKTTDGLSADAVTPIERCK